jgi:DNA modification methylase
MSEPGTAVVHDIHPKSPTERLSDTVRQLSAEDLAEKVELNLASAVLGMSTAFIARALDRPGTRPRTLTLEQVIDLLDIDGYQETFVRRSQIPRYLLDQATTTPEPTPIIDGRTLTEPLIELGNARDLIQRLAPGSIQAVVTSTPYWGMRIYENTRPVKWADGEHCIYGFEQTPEGFIRHTIEVLYLLKPALAADASVWWNVMDTYNTRTPIRGNARERLDEMGGVPDFRRGWTDHDACRHSAGHMFLADAEQCSIPTRIAERASRIGYRLISTITWRKHTSTPEPVRNRVTRQVEYILCLSPSAKPPVFLKDEWKTLAPELGGPNEKLLESKERITDIWTLPVAQGKEGHGAEFPVALPGRCISLSSSNGDVILDPFLGRGTTAVAARALNRRCIGFDISSHYVELANTRLRSATNDRATQNHTEGQLQLQSAGTSPTVQNGTGENPLTAPAEPAIRRGRPRNARDLVPASPSAV